MKHLRVPLLVGLLSLAATIAAAQTGIPAPEVSTIIARARQALENNRAGHRPYRVFRDYKFYGENRDKVNAQVIAEVDFQPPSTKNYVIREATGSDRGENIVRRMLEQERAASRQQNATELSEEKYEFALLRQEQRSGAHCFVVQLTPKRKDKSLLKGIMWIDANTFLIHHIEGELAKSPSFWLKDVHLRMDFSNVEGMWLRTATEAVANVRFFGEHSMLERDLKYETAPVMASNSNAKRSRMASARRTVIVTPALVRP